MLRSSIVLTTLLVPALAQAADDAPWEPGERIVDALSAQITQAGLDQIEGLVVELVPGLLAGQNLDVGDVGGVLYNVKVGLDVLDVDIRPRARRPGADLELVLTADLRLNSQSEPYTIDVPILCDGQGWLAPTTIDLMVPIGIVFTGNPGQKKIDLEVESEDIEITWIDQLDFRGECGGVASFLANAIKGAAVQYLLGPQLDPLLEELQGTVADALDSAHVVEELDVLGKQLRVELTPNQIFSYANGLELIYSARMSSAQDPCVAEIDPLGSKKTATSIPPITGSQSSQVAAYVSDDMLNQALYAAFSGGILCITVDEEMVGDSLPAGLALDTSLVRLLAGNDYEDILPKEKKPLLIQTRPTTVPMAHFNGPDPITIDLEGFGVDFITEIEHRQARLIGLGVTAHVGADVLFDDLTGTMAVELSGLSADAFELAVVGDVLIPGTEDTIVEKTQGLLGTVLNLALGGLTDSLSFALPSFEGFGLSGVALGASPGADDWLLVDAEVGPVGYEGAGCDGGDGGCGGGCDGGCSTGQVGLGTWMLVALPAWVLRRRRA